MNKYRSGSVIGCFGLPCTGKTTVIKALIQSSKELIAHISSGDIARKLSTVSETKHMADGNLFPNEELLRAEIYNTVIKRRSSGAELIILDGVPRTAEQVKWMLDNQMAGTEIDGCLIKVHCDLPFIKKRAQERMRNEQDKFEALMKKIDVQSKLIDEMERTIFQYGIPYYVVVNNEMTLATMQLAKILGLKK